MQINQKAKKLFIAALPLALAWSLAPVPAQACAGAPEALWAFLAVPVAAPAMLFALMFGARRKEPRQGQGKGQSERKLLSAIAGRLQMMLGGLILTFLLMIPCYGMLMDMERPEHHAGILAHIALLLAPPVISLCTVYVASEPEDSALGKAWTFTKNAMWILAFTLIAIQGCAAIAVHYHA
jgi:hypothetical protein